MSENSNELKHYGIRGMRWGIRRYENQDGTLTEAGKKRYAKTGQYGYEYKSHSTKKYEKKASKAENKGNLIKASRYKDRAKRSKEIDKREEEYARDQKSFGEILKKDFMLRGYSSKTKSLRLGMIAAKKNKRIKDLTEDDKRPSLGKAFISANFGLDSLGGSLGARREKAKYIRQDERRDAELAKYFKKEAKKLPKSERKDAFKIGVSTTVGSTNPAFRKRKKKA